MQKQGTLECMKSLLLSILFLLGLGLVQVYSSSFIFAIESFDDGLFFVKKQALFVVAAILVLFVVMHMSWKWLERVALALWIASFAGTVLTLIPGLGVRVGGATRWLNIGAGFRFEPSELLKYTYPTLMAFVLCRDSHNEPMAKKIFLNIVPFLPLGVLLAQPDFGSAALVVCMLFAIFFSRQMAWRYVIASFACIAVSFYFLIARVPYRMNRVVSFLDPWSDPAKKGFQVIQSMLGFYSGGLTGVGLGQGQGKLFFLPEAHTDFTLSVLGEELGFIGVMLVLFIFGFVVLRGLQISVRALSEREQVTALGISLLFAMTAMINIGVAMGMLPTKGLGMPFLSYGGSALIATCFGLGLLLNIDRRVQLERQRSFIKINKS